MKKQLVTILSLFVLAGMAIAQDEPTDFSDRDPRDREQAPQIDQMNFLPNNVLVKFKDEVQLKSGTLLKSAGITAVDRLLESHGVENLVKLFPSETNLKAVRVVKDPMGQDMVIPSLHNIYKIVLPESKSADPSSPNINELIQQLEEFPEVEYAEPNHIFSIGDFTPVGCEMTMLEAMEQLANISISQEAAGLIPSDPLYSSQWGIPATKIDVVWNTTTGDSTAVIAILDTGVDEEHPDLEKNIWKNSGEIPNNGIDEDGNGFIDDIWGWDFINNDNAPLDDNSHGTHVAGIAAAVGDNGIGIAGVNWSAKIMAIKVFQSSGRGDVATIAKGITYAAENGATVLNMSFGSYAESLTMRNALANAYASAVLVAAAGNDALCIGPSVACAPLFPAAYSFVLGVEANNNIEKAGFSNYDQDGPVFSKYGDLLNYELKAPGAGILSCVPGGNYREFNGTSMAAPLVAGAVSLYRKQKPEESQEMLYGNFIHSINQHIDLDAALNIVPEPRLDIVSYELKDTIDGDGDGRPDAGETIELFVKVRNTWGQVNDVKVGIEFGEFEDTTTAEIQVDSALVGSISAYATQFNTVPLKLKIGADVADGRDIVFRLKTWYGNQLGESAGPLVIVVENGIELKGVLNGDMTLYPNKHYIITDNLAVAEGVTLTIKPGTTLKLGADKSIVSAGKVIAVGTPDSMILFTKRDLSNTWKGIKVGTTGEFYVDFVQMEYSGKSTTYTIEIDYGGKVYFSNSLYTKNFGYIDLRGKNPSFVSNVFTENTYDFFGIFYYLNQSQFKNNNIINNWSDWEDYGAIKYGFYYPDSLIENSVFSNYSSGQEINIQLFRNNFQILNMPPNYYGTINDEKIDKGIIDFNENSSLALFDVSNKLIQPSNKNHGLVWKVVVNGIDAQDEFDLLDPLGVGSQKFEVYFNRAMDTSITPKVSMGVRYPYNQTVIAENGSWSADSTIYTVFGNVGLTTGDGINTIRVTGAKDTDHFEIPVEDRRFQVIVDAAGSASTEFQATPGLGRVGLEWNHNSLDDGLGYNMYRMEQINDSTLSEPVMINSTLIADTLYTDFAVTPNKKYFYYYKILRTNLAETDSSKVVAAVPFTADFGDANGDLAVNVSDVVNIISYILENNPQPFIFEAADINVDGIINVLDVVGVVNIILSPGLKSLEGLHAENAEISIENGIVYVTSPIALAGLQFTLADVASEQDVEILEALKSFEVGRVMKDGKLTILAYSLSGKIIEEGKTPLLKLKSSSSWISDVVLSNTSGESILWNFTEGATATQLLKLNSGFSLGQNFPNPFSGNTTIPFELAMDVEEVRLSVYDIMGREVKVWQLKNVNSGSHQVEWTGYTRTGLFIYKMHIKQDGMRSFNKTQKMVIN